MKLLSRAILIIFISLSVFGVLGMMGDTMHEGNTCLASLAQNGACPPPDHTVASALFHTSALKVFSTTLLSLALTLLSLALLFAGFLEELLRKIHVGTQTLALRTHEALSRYRTLHTLRLSLVLLEHSPTSH